MEIDRAWKTIKTETETDRGELGLDTKEIERDNQKKSF